MELKNIDKATELIKMYRTLRDARNILSKADAYILVGDIKGDSLELPSLLKANVINAVNCEYERTRKEISEL